LTSVDKENSLKGSFEKALDIKKISFKLMSFFGIGTRTKNRNKILIY